jgi:hypothetical protein
VSAGGLPRHAPMRVTPRQKGGAHVRPPWRSRGGGRGHVGSVIPGPARRRSSLIRFPRGAAGGLVFRMDPLCHRLCFRFVAHFLLVESCALYALIVRSGAVLDGTTTNSCGSNWPDLTNERPIYRLLCRPANRLARSSTFKQTNIDFSSVSFHYHGEKMAIFFKKEHILCTYAYLKSGLFIAHPTVPYF